MIRYGAKALPEGGWNTIPRVYMDGGAHRGRRRRVPELDAPQGHPPRDADRHAGRRDRVRRGPRGRHVCGRAEGVRRRIEQRGARASCIPCATSIRRSATACSRAWCTRASRSSPAAGGIATDAGACRLRAHEDARRSTTATSAGSRVARQPVKIDRAAHVRQAHQRALFGHAASRGSAVAPDRARRRGLPHALPRGVRQPVHAVLSGQRLRDGRRGRRHEEAADQRVELRPLQDVRHHGPVPGHRLGARPKAAADRSTTACRIWE